MVYYKTNKPTLKLNHLEGAMKRKKLHFRPLESSNLPFDESYDELNRDWRLKAAALQARRWRAIKRETEGGT